jgi:L-amino acid N-acyltransferase YncA
MEDDMINIRIASLGDLETIVNIYNQAVSVGQKTADIKPLTVSDRHNWFLNHTPDKYPIFVAELNEAVIGWLSLSSYRPGREAMRYTQEVSYYISFDYHGQGVGSKLLEHAIDACPKLGVKTLLAIVIASNQGSVKLLEKYHFEKWGELPNVADFDGVEFGHLYYGRRINA